jgi:hypothetical protein
MIYISYDDWLNRLTQYEALELKANYGSLEKAYKSKHIISAIKNMSLAEVQQFEATVELIKKVDWDSIVSLIKNVRGDNG